MKPDVTSPEGKCFMIFTWRAKSIYSVPKYLDYSLPTDSGKKSLHNSLGSQDSRDSFPRLTIYLPYVIFVSPYFISVVVLVASCSLVCWQLSSICYCPGSVSSPLSQPIQKESSLVVQWPRWDLLQTRGRLLKRGWTCWRMQWIGSEFKKIIKTAFADNH